MESVKNNQQLNDCKNGLLYVDIAFDKKDFVKNIGGRFDSEFKMWYVDFYVSRTDLTKLLNMKENEEYIVRIPKYLSNKFKNHLDRQKVIDLFDSYKKPKYCCCCGLSLVAIGSRRKNGNNRYDWSSRATHKSCFAIFLPLEEHMFYDVHTGKKLID